MSSLVNDVHGTALAVVHNTKYTLTRNFADPFGGRRGEVLDTPGDRGFLGKVEDTTGLTSVGARYYDSGVGRFVSVDPVMDLGDPQQWSAYTYANNNPVTWSDPTGLLSWKGAWSSVKKGASAVGKWASKNKAEIIGGVVGTVVGVGCAVFTAGLGSVACAVAGGALAGAITNAVRQSSSGKPFSWRSFATETALGGAGGLLGFGIGAAASKWIAPVATRAVQGAVSAVRASTSRGGQAVASSARGTVSQARNSAAQVAGTKPIPANKPKPPTAPSGTSNARPTAPVKNPQTAHTKGQTTGQCSCAGATPVLMASGEHKAIEDIEVGDQVIATDPLTAKQAAMPVTHVWVHEDDLFEFEVNGELIVTTEDHPFWSVTDQTWEGTQSLGRGELVLGADGNVLPVTRPVDLRAHERGSAYNLTVAGAHSYHVGLNGVLVHNSGRPGPEDAYLWRAVTGAELSDISSARQWHSPQGVKYFAFSEASAAEYARRAYSAYPHEGVYTMIRTTVRMSDLPDDARMAYTTDVKGGGVALSNDQLKVLGRPSIMPGGIQGAGVC